MLRGLLIAAAVPAALWSGYWGAGALALKQGANGFLKDGQNGDLSSRFAQAQVSGYPGAFNLTLSDLHIEDAGLFAWSIPSAQLHAPSYRPQAISLDIDGVQEIHTVLGAVTLDAEAFQIEAFVRPSLDMPLGRAQLQMGETHLSHEAGWGLHLNSLQVTLRDAADLVEAPVTGIYQVEASAALVDLSELLPDLPETHHQVLEFSADLQLAFSQALDRHALVGDPPSLSEIIIEQADIRLGGSQVAMSGQLRVVEDGRLSGTVTLEVTKWQELMEAMREGHYVNPDIADLVTNALLEQGMTDQLTIPLRVQDGVIQFGMFRLGVLPRLP